MILNDYGRMQRRAALDSYIKHGVPLEDEFLRAVVFNDLFGACARADQCDINVIPVYVNYLYNEAPALCHGSPQAYQGWLALKGKA
jgi:hypothetical protein